jgi:transcriptional/translational regulatory protein YebC/TACO1
VRVDATRYGEDDLLVAVEAGAEDIVTDEDVLEVYTAPSDLSAVRIAIEGAGVEIEGAEVIQRPSVRVELDEAQATRLFRLIEALEDDDDVAAVHANFEVSDEILEKVVG